MFSKTLAVSAALVASVAADRTIVVYNGCPFTIWPAIFTASGTANTVTGWSAAEYTHVTFTVSDSWDGRIWGRRDCTFTGSTLPSTCLTGGCNGGLECDTVGGTGVPPATLAEFNIGASGTDWYDVSNVDGSDLPMSITNNVGCPQPQCFFDLNSECPSALAVYDTNGYVIGCKSACDALGGANNCCTGADDTPATCPSSGVEYYSYFKNNCPDAYAYAYDEASGSSLWTCASSKAAEYTVTFCPPTEVATQ